MSKNIILGVETFLEILPNESFVNSIEFSESGSLGRNLSLFRISADSLLGFSEH